MSEPLDAVDLCLQVATATNDVPVREDFVRWAQAALPPGCTTASITVRIVDEDESAALNARWRGRTGATNVLSFPLADPDGPAPEYLGDLVICAPLVVREAQRDGKQVDAHWAHLVVHGMLHLLGHDHEESAQAEAMETLERTILAALGLPDPYRVAAEVAPDA